MFDLKEFGRLLQKIRKKRKMSQIEFAQFLGYTASYISRVERGKANLSMQAIEKVTKKLNIKIRFFFEQ
ncbi:MULTISPECIES: helix-turn-helix domain-containing protein [Bacillus]|uniref:XRE family transcriptional regulator n=2 Tax=Bacillaceae TaxID=186817 RepID=A0ABC8D9B8_BACVE|nr:MULTISPECIES: helix-turn-helix transcriptional regulator [Bacillus]AJC23666.1 XRE family transcriptional regulator [Bacillus sp. Pc3]AQP98094.1 transcriptional regulator [Bacillus sp. 275]MDH3082520.1 helix-turn-helix transcriptional regulator [Bacillus subtilis]AKF30753.1 XRE family transcriptional regulator [Bacillus velezensis]ANB49543.1 XRE family transcriptional regulator [Bacillus velezensis]